MTKKRPGSFCWTFKFCSAPDSCEQCKPRGSCHFTLGSNPIIGDTSNVQGYPEI